MPTIRELREQQFQPTEEKSGSGLFIVGVVAAFAVGALLVGGWKMLPSMTLMVSNLSGKSGPAFAPAKVRLGVAEKAPLLEQCSGAWGKGDLGPAAFFALMKTNDRVMGIARMAGSPHAAGPTHISLAWGELADCVYRQNGRAFCEPNNRALAVEAAISVVREADGAAPPPRDGFAKAQAALNSAIERRVSELSDMKDRVLRGLRGRLEDGRLIAADFGYLAPADLRRVLQDVKPTRNGCAEEGLPG